MPNRYVPGVFSGPRGSPFRLEIEHTFESWYLFPSGSVRGKLVGRLTSPEFDAGSGLICGSGTPIRINTTGNRESTMTCLTMIEHACPEIDQRSIGEKS
jgi:hypothetical protein